VTLGGPLAEGQARLRVDLAKKESMSPYAYVWRSTTWAANPVPVTSAPPGTEALRIPLAEIEDRLRPVLGERRIRSKDTSVFVFKPGLALSPSTRGLSIPFSFSYATSGNPMRQSKWLDEGKGTG